MMSGTYGARGVVIDDKLYIGGGDCKVWEKCVLGGKPLDSIPAYCLLAV